MAKRREVRREEESEKTGVRGEVRRRRQGGGGGVERRSRGASGWRGRGGKEGRR